MIALLQKVGAATRGASCRRWMPLMAALCRWRSEVDVLEREADVAIATEAARREVLLGLLLDADSASRIQAVLTLLEESRQRATFAELALEAVSAEFDGIFNTEGASIATVLGDILSHASECTGPTSPPVPTITQAGAN